MQMLIYSYLLAFVLGFIDQGLFEPTTTPNDEYEDGYDDWPIGDWYPLDHDIFNEWIKYTPEPTVPPSTASRSAALWQMSVCMVIGLLFIITMTIIICVTNRKVHQIKKQQRHAAEAEMDL